MMAWQRTEKVENAYDVVIIGAGVSGINFAYRLQERCPHLSYTILEGRHELGGTWSLFKFPGVRSDSDLYTFGFPWRPWTEKTAMAQGDMIKSYLASSAEMYGIDGHIQYHHQVDSAAYSSARTEWTVEVTADRSQKKTFTCRFLLFCTGYYDYQTPLQVDLPGINDFAGTVVHPQFWPEDLDYTDKDVVVIGSGATAITVLPAMAEAAKSVTMLQRSPSYVLSIPSQDPIEMFLRFSLSWAPDLQHSFIRLKWIFMQLILRTISSKFPQRMRSYIYKETQRQLPQSIPHDPHFTPSYFPGEQRMCMCPDGDFFQALREGKARVETGTIERITKDSIKLHSGTELTPDIIVTATGIQLRFAGKVQISVDGKQLNPAEKFVWKGVMIEDLPNAAFVLGYVDASWTLGADATAQLITRMLNTMQHENALEVTPRQSPSDRANLNPSSLLRLNSTYIQKGAHELPKSGDRGQWLPRSSYLPDLFYAWYGDLKTNVEWVRAE